MGWTKRQFVEQAFAEIGMVPYVFDLSPAQLQNALIRLDVMMAMWNADGIRLSYPLPSSPLDSDLDEETTVPDASYAAIYSNLAIMLAPTYGKAVSPETKKLAKTTYDLLISRASMPMEMQMPASMPAGAGHKSWQSNEPFLSPPTDPLLVGQDGPLEFY